MKKGIIDMIENAGSIKILTWNKRNEIITNLEVRYKGIEESERGIHE